MTDRLTPEELDGMQNAAAYSLHWPGERARVEPRHLERLLAEHRDLSERVALFEKLIEEQGERTFPTKIKIVGRPCRLLPVPDERHPWHHVVHSRAEAHIALLRSLFAQLDERRRAGPEGENDAG